MATDKPVMVATCSECMVELRIEFGLQEAITDHLQVAHGVEPIWLDDAEIEEVNK